VQELPAIGPQISSRYIVNEEGRSSNGDAVEDNGGATGQSAKSKASTVKSAIEHTKRLKQVVADTETRAEDAVRAQLSRSMSSLPLDDRKVVVVKDPNPHRDTDTKEITRETEGGSREEKMKK
jgi:hypothetical protein